MELSEEVIKDGRILEAKIATLIDEFEQKHKPHQVSIITRWRNCRDLYKISKGGSAQISIHDLSYLPIEDFPHIVDNGEIVYSDRR